MADEAYLLTRVLHVLFAVAWMGGLLFYQLVVQPGLQPSKEFTRREIVARMTRPTLKFANITGGLTLLSGLLLITVHPTHGWGDMLSSSWGRLVSFGLVGTVAVLYLLNVAIRPTVNVLERLESPAESGEGLPAGQQLLEKRLVWTGRLITAIFIFVLAAMVLADAVK